MPSPAPAILLWTRLRPDADGRLAVDVRTSPLTTEPTWLAITHLPAGSPPEVALAMRELVFRAHAAGRQVGAS